jgi:hypothetical protein
MCIKVKSKILNLNKHEKVCNHHFLYLHDYVRF